MLGRNIPLRLALSDPEGLDSVLEVWTWLEERDDENGNGVMEEEEYTMQTLSLNRGVTSMEVDLPLLASSDVVPAGRFEGRLSVVVRGMDLAGNPLVGGGGFGASDDLATLLVQQRSDTTVDDVRLDRIDGHLLAGHEHRLTFTLADANGIESLERINLGLMGEDQTTRCFIDYEPRLKACLLYTSPSPRDQRGSRMPSSA